MKKHTLFIIRNLENSESFSKGFKLFVSFVHLPL